MKTKNVPVKGHVTDCSYKAEQEATAQHTKARNSSRRGWGQWCPHTAEGQGTWAALCPRSSPCLPPTPLPALHQQLAHPHHPSVPPRSSLNSHIHYPPSVHPEAHGHAQGQCARPWHFPGPSPGCRYWEGGEWQQLWWGQPTLKGALHPLGGVTATPAACPSRPSLFIASGQGLQGQAGRTRSINGPGYRHGRTVLDTGLGSSRPSCVQWGKLIPARADPA